MLMLGRCLPHIVPNVLLAKREVRNPGILLFIFTRVFFLFALKMLSLMSWKSVTCNPVLTFVHASLLLENGFTPLSGEFSKPAWYPSVFSFKARSSIQQD